MRRSISLKTTLTKYIYHEAIIFQKTVDHPLFKRGTKIYKNRQKAKNKNRQQLLKYRAACLHSTGSMTKPTHRVFSTPEEATTYIKDKFGVQLRENQSHIELLFKLASLPKFKIHADSGYIHLEHPDLESKNTIFSLPYIVTARARLKMLITIEKLLKAPSVEICYTNTDSIHLSVKESQLKDLLYSIEGGENSYLGHLRLEAIADNAIWLGIGQYWLFSEGKIENFKNSPINKKYENNPVKETTSYLAYDQRKQNIIKLYSNGAKRSSINKKVELPTSKDFINLERYSWKNISSIDARYFSLINQEVLQEPIRQSLKKYIYKGSR